MSTQKAIENVIARTDTPRRRRSQPKPVWRDFMQAASHRIAKRNGWQIGDALEQIAAEIVAFGDGDKFLAAVRRGRPTDRQNQRYQLLRWVEAHVGPAKPRRREDRNTPERAGAAMTASVPGEEMFKIPVYRMPA